jgi:hypothetical protein
LVFCDHPDHTVRKAPDLSLSRSATTASNNSTR